MREESTVYRLLLLLLPLAVAPVRAATASFDLEKALSSTCTTPCYSGVCLNNTCVCTTGWKGAQCDFCQGRVRISDNFTTISESPVSYTSQSNCAWLIDNNSSTSLTLRVSSLQTECGWDYVHIYDGVGTDGEQIAALCGTIDNPFEMQLKSHSSFVFFLSDIAGNQEGFNITVQRGRCAYNCNGNGNCLSSGVCQCKEGFLGEHCERRICLPKDNGKPGPCQLSNNCLNGKCDCGSYSHGEFCQARIQESFWEPQDPSIAYNWTAGRASHASVMANESKIWTVSGERFHNVKSLAELQVYDINTRTTTTVSARNQPPARYDHTLVKYKSFLFMFGGVVDRRETVSELWRFDMTTNTWTMITDNNKNLSTPPLAVAGHTAHVIGHKMYIIFGYNPYRRFVHDIQVYDLVNNTWSTASVQDQVYGRYGHSSVLYDAQIILIYGGISDPLDSGNNKNNISESLLEFNVKTGTFTNLKSSGTPLFKHSAAILNGLMIVVGGNNQKNDSNQQTDCFQGSVLMYDIECKLWYTDSAKKEKNPLLRRYGHSMVANDDNVFIVGGYNGTMLSDVVKFTPAQCGSETKPDNCMAVHDGVRCIYQNNKCITYSPTSSYPLDFVAMIKNGQLKATPTCPGREFWERQAVAVCEELQDCLKCSSQSGCGWCVAGNQCLPSDSECVDGQEMIRAYTKCGTEAATRQRERPCSMALDCFSCKLQSHCNWFGYDSRNQCISLKDEADLTSEMAAREAERLAAATVPVKISSNTFPTGLPMGTNLSTCPIACADYSTCSDCVSKSCMWCGSQKRCVNTDSYLISFPYGQCHQWTTSIGEPDKPLCELESSECILHKTCSDCQLDPNCGWLDEGKNTGTGTCLTGTKNGPLNSSYTGYKPDLWYFVGCPQCQCNGHSECIISSKGPIDAPICKGCQNNTAGSHCEKCAKGFHGDSLNGGMCKPCECKGKSDGCDPYTGQCYCVSKGVIGDQCQSCDAKYQQDPTNGNCYYELTVDFIFTFKLKDPPDKYISEIFLFSIPYKRETDVTFQINCDPVNERQSTAAVSLNLTTNLIDGHTKQQRQKMVNQPCDKSGFRRVYSASDPSFTFGSENNTTFFVRVHNFSVPYEIKISFAQSPPINWVLFFVIFAACFIVLLVLAGLLWMVKLRIEAYRTRQNQITEIVQMASRPFRSILIDLSNPTCNSVATPIAIEPRSNYRAGIFTLAVRLPTGGKSTTPNSTSGMALASALCYLSPSQEACVRGANEGENRPKRKTNLRRYLPFFRRSTDT